MLSLLYRDSGTLTRIGEVRLDAAVREEHVATARVTESPVESGSKISDHVYLEPETLNIDGVITDSPVYLHPNSASEDDGLLTVPLASSGSRAIDAFEALRRLLANRQPITVVTGLHVYSNMVLTSVNVPREPESGLALRFSCELRQVLIVRSQTVPPNKATAKKKTKAAKKADRGRQSAKATTKPSNLPPAIDPEYLEAWEMETKKPAQQKSTIMDNLISPESTVERRDVLDHKPVELPEIRKSTGVNYFPNGYKPKQGPVFRADRNPIRSFGR